MNDKFKKHFFPLTYWGWMKTGKINEIRIMLDIVLWCLIIAAVFVGIAQFFI